MEIEHEADRNRFIARTGDGEAELSYSVPEDGVLDLQHTLVPPGARDRGIGASLAQAAVAYARSNGMRIIPTCGFVRAWLSKHPEAEDLVWRGAAGR